jgi:hypothetical protein
VSKNFERDYKELIEKLKLVGLALNKPDVTRRLANKVKLIVYRRVKSGYGVNSDREGVDDVKRKKLKELSKTYIEYRKGIAIYRRTKNGGTLRITREKRTIAIRGKESRGNKKRGIAANTRVRFAKKWNFTKPKLGPFGRAAKSNLTLTGQMLESMQIRNGLDGFEVYIPKTSRTTPEGKRDKLTNKKVAEYVSEDRPFMALTSGELRILRRECEEIIKEKIKHILGSSRVVK